MKKLILIMIVLTQLQSVTFGWVTFRFNCSDAHYGYSGFWTANWMEDDVPKYANAPLFFTYDTVYNPLGSMSSSPAWLTWDGDGMPPGDATCYFTVYPQFNPEVEPTDHPNDITWNVGFTSKTFTVADWDNINTWEFTQPSCNLPFVETGGNFYGKANWNDMPDLAPAPTGWPYLYKPSYYYYWGVGFGFVLYSFAIAWRFFRRLGGGSEAGE